MSVTRILCGRTPKIRKISTLEDEAVGAGRGPETEFEDAIRGQKSVAQKQADPQIPVKPLKGKKGDKEACRVSVLNFPQVDYLLSSLPSNLYSS